MATGDTVTYSIEQARHSGMFDMCDRRGHELVPGSVKMHYCGDAPLGLVGECKWCGWTHWVLWSNADELRDAGYSAHNILMGDSS